MQSPTLVPEFVILLAVVGIRPLIHLDFPRGTGSPDGGVACLTIDDEIIEDVQSPTLVPEFVVLLAVVGIRPLIHLDFPRGTGSPDGCIKYLVVDHAIFQKMQSPTLVPEFVVLLAVVGIRPVIHLNFTAAFLLPSSRDGHINITAIGKRRAYSSCIGAPDIKLKIIDKVIR